MKKLLASSVLLILIVILTSCSNKTNVPNPQAGTNLPATESLTPTEDVVTNSNEPAFTTPPGETQTTESALAQYYPIRNNTNYYYEGSGNEFASYEVDVDYTTENSIQERVSNGGTVSARVITIENGYITRVFSQGEIYYRENCLDKTDDKKEVLLMEPLEKGTTWLLNDGRQRTITNLSYSIETPLGNYQAIEVTTKSTTDTSYDYYVKGIGLVKSLYVSDGMEVSSTLKKIQENTVYSQDVQFYYPSLTDGIHTITKTIDFKTNDITKELLEAAYKSAVPDLEAVFTKNTQINHLYLNKDGAVYIDLNADFLAELKKGKQYETFVLQCIANTFGQYYTAQKVLLTIENAPYQSDTISMKKGQFLIVNPSVNGI